MIGGSGTTLLGAGGYLTRAYSSEKVLPLNYTFTVDVSRFMTSHLAVRAGLIGSDSRGGDEADKEPTGLGAAALFAHGGLFYYLHPKSMWSPYAGVAYWLQTTQRESTDRGTGVLALGLEGAISSRVHLFGEGSYGIGFSGNGERTNRLVAYGGVRIVLRR